MQTHNFCHGIYLCLPDTGFTRELVTYMGKSGIKLNKITYLSVKMQDSETKQVMKTNFFFNFVFPCIIV